MKYPVRPLIRAAFVVALLAALQPAFATNYYFSTSDGADNRPAQVAERPTTPWKTLAKLNSIFSGLKAGDSIFFKRGDVFAGSLSITASGTEASPIVLTAYGTGAKPVISGFTTFSGWTSLGNNRWIADAAVERINVVTVNDAYQPIGRWPNATAAAGGYLTIESHSGNTSISSNAIASGTNWNGGEVVIRKNRWILDANKITGHNGGTINYSSESGYHATQGYGFFIQNHIGTLDLQGEWCHQLSKLGVYLTGNASSYVVEASTVPVLISANGRSNVLFSELAFTGANTNAFELKNGSGFSIVDCNIANTGVNVIDASNCGGLRIEASEIARTGNIALNLSNCWNAVVRNNTITATGAIAGMGKGGDGTYEAILLSGDNNLVEGNSIENTGYIPITFSGSSVTVKNNYINAFGLVKDDGGGIYTWNNSNNPPNHTARKVVGNIILNGKSAIAGTNETAAKFSHGIYLDDNAANVDVSGNTIAHCEGFGIYVHNAKDNNITGNTAFNNAVQIALVHDDIAPNHPIRNTTINNNIFFALQPTQLAAEFKSRAADLADFGSFTANRYGRPLDDNATIGVLKNVNGTYSYALTDVEGWQAMYGKDQGASASPKTFKPYAVSSVVSGNKFGNGSFASNIGGLYAFSSSNNCNTSFQSGVLDGGSLAVNFSSLTSSSKGTVVIGVGSLTAGKRYLLKFSLKGPAEQKMLDVYLRKSGAPYNDVTDRKLVKVKADRTEVELLYTATETTSDGSIGIDVPEHAAAVYFDNIDLREVLATDINPTDSIKFFVNPTPSAVATAVAGPWLSATATAISNSLSLSPFASAILLANGGQTVVNPPSVICTATGTIQYERWTGVGGNSVAQIPLSQSPSITESLTAFEGVRDAGDNYGSRIRGYICPPQTGAYTFYISGDDGTELWLSSSDNPANKTRIAYSLSWTNFREWTKYATQKSATIQLEAGKKYYIEALHKEGGGGDHLSVAWTLPNGTMEAPIAGSRLSPFVAAPLQSQAINFPSIPDFIMGSSSSISLAATASSGLPISYSIVSGTANINGASLTGFGVGVVTVKASQAGNSQYAAAADVTQSITIVPAPVVLQCAATGTILREQWNGVSGNDVVQIPVAATPASSTQLNVFEGPQNAGEAYGSRVRGYICAPQTGNYTFYIAGDDATELWLSSDDAPANKTKIAYSLLWTAHRQWNKYATQKSAAIYLEAGKKYYIEALQKEGGGGDHLSVAWTFPDGTFEAPIAGSRLSPFVPAVSTAQCSATGTILLEQWTAITGNDVAQVPQSATPNRSTQISKIELDQNSGDNYGSRIRGYICPPQTGAYTFYISGDDGTELWLSSSDNPANKTRIAYSLSWTNFREWTKYATQKSAIIQLEAGKKYYIEALHKEGGGGDHLSVAWTLPDGSFEAPIGAARISPFGTSTSGRMASIATTEVVESKAAVDVATLETKPAHFAVEVFPNPMASTTTVTVSTTKPGTATIQLTDAAGKVVKAIFSRGLQSGATQQYLFDAAGLAKGIYFLRVATVDGIVTRKLVKT